MPTYEYYCSECGKTVEIFKSLKELDREEHCQCDGEPMIRVCGNRGGFRLDGTGWAADGYATYYGDAVKFRSK